MSDLERPKTMNVTRTDRAAKCPRSLMLDLEIGDAPSHEKSRGTLFHLFAERWIEVYQESGEWMPGEVAREEAQSLIEENPDEIVSEAEMDAVRGMAYNLAEHHRPRGEIVAVEKLMAMKIGNWIVRGKADLVTRDGDTIFIDDYKTSFYVPSGEDVHDDLKLKLYALLVGEGKVVSRDGEILEDRPIGLGAQTFIPRLVFPRYVNTDTQEVVTRNRWKGDLVPIERFDFSDLKRSVEAILARVDRGFDKGEWPAVPGSWCSICPASSRCPIPAEQRPLVVTNAQEAVQLAEVEHVVDQQQRERRKQIKAYCSSPESGGNVAFGDQRWEFVKQESQGLARKTKAQAKELIAAGQPVPPTMYETTVTTRFTKKRA